MKTINKVHVPSWPQDLVLRNLYPQLASLIVLSTPEENYELINIGLAFHLYNTL